MTCIVSYDIESDRIRNRLARFLEKKGVRLQKSVFAIEIERHVFNGLLKGIETITKKQGKVAVFRLCEGCLKNAVQMNKDEKDVYVF
ncbi:MAG: CRISPR-associated endonuclease Cas2 [Syntrophorhabdaceae bacterium]|nr:CRISPR-associated endonuclease Cas2 [Syntrophorhabdaceae bacterium]